MTPKRSPTTFLNFVLYIGVQPINNVVVGSGAQQSYSAVHIHVSILPQSPLPPRPPHDIDHSSLCYTVGPGWLSILNTGVCTCPSQTLEKSCLDTGKLGSSHPSSVSYSLQEPESTVEVHTLPSIYVQGGQFLDKGVAMSSQQQHLQQLSDGETDLIQEVCVCEEAPTASTISTGVQNTLSSSLYRPFIAGKNTTSPSCSFLTYLK